MNDWMFCTYRPGGVICYERNSCAGCGWNPKVESSRKDILHEQGMTALVREPKEPEEKPVEEKKPDPKKPRPPKEPKRKIISTEELGEFILRHDEKYGGDLSGAQIRSMLHVGREKYYAARREAVRRLARQEMEVS